MKHPVTYLVVYFVASIGAAFLLSNGLPAPARAHAVLTGIIFVALFAVAGIAVMMRSK